MNEDLSPFTASLVTAAYERQIEYLLRDNAAFRQLLPPPGPPPPWRVRRWRRAKVKLRTVRTSIGLWIGGIEPHDCWDC